MTELLIILLCLFAGFIASVSIITKISIHYRTHYGFSIWSGVIILLVAFVILLMCNFQSNEGSIFSFVLSGGLCLFTLAQDIRLCGWLYGMLGMAFQIIMTMLIFVFVLIIIARIIARMIFRRTRSSPTSFYNAAQELQYAIILFPVFIRI